MINVPDWVADAQRLMSNPQLVAGRAFNQLSATLDGQIEIVNPTNPFVHLMVTSAVNASALMNEMAAHHQKQYPSMALTDEELYLHMSDQDYVSRFAQPARARFLMFLAFDEVLAGAVPVGNTGIRKMTIPRHTQVEVAGMTFMMQYPVDIRIMPSGALQVVYDNAKPSPLQVLTSNLVPFTQVLMPSSDGGRQRMLRIELPMRQMKVSSIKANLNLSTLFDQTYDFSDRFHYARVFHVNAAGVREELTITHTDQVFDPAKPTALLQVLEGRLRVRIPQIYLTTRQVTNSLSIDIYTTRGPLDVVLSDYGVSQYKSKWVDLDRQGTDPYAAAFSALNTRTVFSDDTVVGGRLPLSFAELRERVLNNALGGANIPITAVQTGSRLSDLGYDMVVDVDHITRRQFLATRVLPEPMDGSTISGAGCTMATLTESMDNLSQLPSVVDNGVRITIKPDTLYQNVNGLLSIVGQTAIDAIRTLPVDVRARRINENNYLYTPFHYVLDMSDDRFAHRPYYLEQPIIETKSFVDENATTGISVGVKSYQIDRVPEGYLVTLILKSGQVWKDLDDDQVFCQMAFYPTNERNRAYQNGTLVGFTPEGERIYTFLLGTNYDLDERDSIMLNTFQMFADPVHVYPCPLRNDFDVFFGVNQVEIESYEKSEIDDNIGRNLLTEDTIGLAHEMLTIVLGSSLQGLWSSSRSIVSSQDYRRYLADVPALWERDIYETDPVTGATKIEIDPDTQELKAVYLHRKGDPILNDKDEPVMRYFAGDIMHDNDGNPIVESSRRMLRSIDLFMLDGAYWFADEVRTLDYRRELPGVVVTWLEQDIAPLQSELLEETVLQFYPKSTLGHIPVRVQEDRQVTINSAQTFSVVYSLTGAAFRDAALRQSLTQAAKEVIHSELQKPIVTMSAIISALNERVRGDTLGLSVIGLGGSTPYDTVTLLDDSARLSIRKKAVARADNTIGVEDDVTVTFQQHTSD